MHTTTNLRTLTGSSTRFSNFPRFFSVLLQTSSLSLPPSGSQTNPIDFTNRRTSHWKTTDHFNSHPIQPLSSSYSLYHHFSSSPPPPSVVTSSKTCSSDSIGAPFIHAQTIKTCGIPEHLNVYNHLLRLYLKGYNFDEARRLFDEMPVRDVRTWTVLIMGFARKRSSDMVLALDLFVEMQLDGVRPNHFTLSCVLRCCANVENLDMGKKIHGWILRNGVVLDVTLENSMLHLYVKCGAFDYARNVFGSMNEKDIVSWNIMIDGYLQNGDTDLSIELFRRLPSKDAATWNTIIVGLMRNGCDSMAMKLLNEMSGAGVVFNEVTFSTALILAASLSVLELGRQIHCKILKLGFEGDEFIRNSLIDMYCKCGVIDDALEIFNRESQVSENLQNSLEVTLLWSSIISGYVQNGRTEDAVNLFHRMVSEGFPVDQFTLTSVASACADVGMAEQATQIHAMIEKLGHKLDDFLVSAIIDMYAKCGRLDDALSIFYQCHTRNIVLWTSVISGCALHGQGREAIRIFELMLKEGIRPNEISFVGVLSGCSHAGLVEEGQKYFKFMQECYDIMPKLEHFTCMVDLLGRAGSLNEAKDFIYENGISHQSAVWRAFLAACRVHKNIELGKLASEKLLELEPLNAGSYVLLSNICTTTQRWKEAAETRSLMQKRGVKKQPGQSWIRLKNQVHTFVMGDRSHPQAPDIYIFLEKLIGKLKEVGYSSDTNLAMHDVEEEQREVLLGFHSEKLAIAYGIMSTPGASPILVMKNLRVCVDCHSAIKYISQITCREITVRDSHRFHHFKHGFCSCRDYW